ncbi:MAG: hypothetical protein E7463_08930 [Ruminococcaceae bacterium]|nr:hypothetical protein [Oscillospiraceae bacterium]
MLIENVTIRIPGLTRDYVFYHTSDAHVAWADPTDSTADRELAATQTQRWNLHGILPPAGFDDTLRTASENHADGLFLCGDIADYYHPSTVRRIRDRLTNAAVEPLYVCGNHEGGSYKNGPRYDKALRPHYPDYAGMMHGTPDLWVRDFGEFLIVGIDDSDKKVRPEQVAALKNLCADGRPILLLMHIPIYTEALKAPLCAEWGDDACDYFVIGFDADEAETPAFCALLRDPAAPIAAVFAGHIHLSHASEIIPGRVQYTSAPSFSGTIRRVTVTGK